MLVTALLLFAVLAILIVANIELFESMTLEDSVEIYAPPEQVWDFFYNLDGNYQTWHPKDHVVFKWIEGTPMEIGTTFYAEEYAMGEVKQYKGKVIEAIQNRKIVFELSYPISIMTPNIEWIIEPKGNTSVFTAVTGVRARGLLRLLLPATMDAIIASGKQHMHEEGINLKEFLEGG